MKLLVTGGLGFIGSHTIVELLNHNYEVVVIDNASNADLSVLNTLNQITTKEIPFFLGDIADTDVLNQILKEHKIEGVIHFAALKSVNESVREPLRYYHNNVAKTIEMIDYLKRNGVTKIVFSSSATVYSPDNPVPFTEGMKRSSSHAYGKSKIMIEECLEGLNGIVDSVSLRYFNPVGAHSSGLLGENPKTEATNLMPIINEVATGKRDHINVFGSDYPTPDGTPLRDYIHVMDVAVAHVKAIEYIMNRNGVFQYNIGTGTSISVLQMITTYMKTNNVSIPVEMTSRREGDVASSFANVSLAQKELRFKAEKSLEEMCKDAFRYVINL